MPATTGRRSSQSSAKPISAAVRKPLWPWPRLTNNAGKARARRGVIPPPKGAGGRGRAAASGGGGGGGGGPPPPRGGGGGGERARHDRADRQQIERQRPRLPHEQSEQIRHGGEPRRGEMKQRRREK